MISSHEFKISEAILEIMDDRKFNQFAGKVLDIGVCMAVEAWNLSLINDETIRLLVIKPTAVKLTSVCNKTTRQIQPILQLLIKRKLKLYPNVYRYIAEYSIRTDEHNEPKVQVLSTDDKGPNYYSDYYRKHLFGDQKYGWVRDGK
jgi:hypothetical protein